MTASFERDDSSRFNLDLLESQPESTPDTHASTAASHEWWTRPTSSKLRVSASSSLGQSSFAAFRDSEAGLGVGRSLDSSTGNPAVPIEIATPHRGRAGTPSSVSPAASSPASQFLAEFSSPRSPDPVHDVQIVAGYELGRTIGSGAFSVVKKATNIKTGSIVAVKIIQKKTPHASESEIAKQLDRERDIWFSLSHDNILPLFATHDTPNATLFVMLCCPSGSLLEAINKRGTSGLSQEVIGPWMNQIVQGLKYLHVANQLVHGDIKLENILLDDQSRCRIADFGLSRPIGAPPFLQTTAPPWETTSGQSSLLRARTMPRHHRNSSPLPMNRLGINSHPLHNFPPGSLAYAAPELLRPSTADSETANPAQDIWALGCIFYALLTGRLPFVDPFEPRLQMTIARGTWEVPSNIGPRATVLLKGCLEMEVSARLSIEEVERNEWIVKRRGTSGGRGRSGSRSRSAGRVRYRSGSRDSPRSPSTHEYIPKTARSLSRDGRRVSPSKNAAQSLSSEDTLPPLSPPLWFERHERRTQPFSHPSSSRSPRYGTPGPGTPVDGQSPSHAARRTRVSPTRTRRHVPESLVGAVGLTILEDGMEGQLHASPLDSELRGRTMVPRLHASPSPMRAVSTPRRLVKPVQGANDDLSIHRGRRSRERLPDILRPSGRSQSLGHHHGQIPKAKKRQAGFDEAG